MRKSKDNQQDKFYVPVLFSMMGSKAWAHLDNHARVVYLYFLKRELINSWAGRKPENKVNWRPEICLSYREMEKIVNSHQFSRAIKMLEEEGFITKRQEGGLYRKRNWYLLSSRWKNT